MKNTFILDKLTLYIILSRIFIIKNDILLSENYDVFYLLIL